MYQKILSLCFLAFLSTICTQVFALENGSDSAALGAEGIMSGNMPPTGTYFVTYYQDYHANKMLNNNGNNAVPNFSLDAHALVARVLSMTDKHIIGGQLGVYGIQPFVDVKLSAAGASDSNKGMGDSVIGSLLAWHNNNHHWGAALETVVPTGDYTKKNERPVVANIGKNYYTFRPTFAYTYANQKGWNISTKASYSINTENKDTHYTSGDYLALDYNIGHALSPKFTAGIAGYALKQLTADKLNSNNIDNKAQVIAYGPSLAYHPSKLWFVEAKYLVEDEVKNRPKGDAAWVKFVWTIE